jgi:3-dehydroquinate dehydratase
VVPAKGKNTVTATIVLRDAIAATRIPVVELATITSKARRALLTLGKIYKGA